jgi:hypothetical protein
MASKMHALPSPSADAQMTDPQNPIEIYRQENKAAGKPVSYAQFGQNLRYQQKNAA